MEAITYVQKKQMSMSLNGNRKNNYQGSSRSFIQQKHALQGMSQSLNGLHRNKFVAGTMSFRGMSLFDHNNRNITIQETDNAVYHQQEQNFNNVSPPASVPSTAEMSTLLNRRSGIAQQQQQCTQLPNDECNEQQYQHQLDNIKNKSMINDSMKMLMESMQRSAMTRELVKQFPSPFSKSHSQSKSNCDYSSTSTPTKKTSKYVISTNKQPIVKARRQEYSYQQNKYNNRTHCIPAEITVISPRTKSTFRFPQSDMESSLFSTRQAKENFLISYSLDDNDDDDDDDDVLSLTSSGVFNDMVSFSSNTSNSSSWLWGVE
jgi:hypothetical protein